MAGVAGMVYAFKIAGAAADVDGVTRLPALVVAPGSFSFTATAAERIIRRAASRLVAMSASLNWVAWKSAMALPNGWE